jgi:hypothetical protein
VKEINPLLIAAIERSTGETAKTLRDEPIEDLRAKREAKAGAPLRFISMFPFIGRGNVLRDKVLSRAEVDRQLLEALR